jgi:hypothetical protein
MTVTKDFLLLGRTANGGYTKAQLTLLGVQWPPRRGWTRRIIGKEISIDTANRFLEERDRK